ncbi:MAG: hypothetical protein AMXMBFR4_32200 [Candidatus Hydrogenedentota bacterium]
MQSPLSRFSSFLIHRNQWPVYAIFLLALAVGAAHHLFMKSSDPSYDFLMRSGDNYNYDRWAKEISQTFWLGWDRLPFSQGPLYPYFLAFVYLRFGATYDAGTLAQVVLGAANVALIFAIARRLFGGATGWIAGSVAAFSPNLLLYQGELLPETLVVFVNLVFLQVLISASGAPSYAKWAGAGAALGLCAIARSNALLSLPLVLGALWWAGPDRKRRLAYTGASAAALAITIAPVTAANYFGGGRLALLTTNGMWNFYIGNAPDASGTYARPDSMWDIVLATGQNEAVIDWMTPFLEHLRDDPAFLPRNLLKKTALFWQSGELPQVENFYLKQSFSPFLRTPLAFGVIAPVGLVGIALAMSGTWTGKLPKTVYLLAGFVFLYSAGIILIFVIARLRLPVVAALIPFAAYAARQTAFPLIIAVRENRIGSVGAWRTPAGIAAACVLLGLALQTRDESLLIRWSDYYNQGSAYEAKDQLESALDSYERAQALKPDSKSVEAAIAGVRDRIETMRSLDRRQNQREPRE